MPELDDRKDKPRSETRQYWSVMDAYERFEHVIALLLSAVIVAVILVALWRLMVEVFQLLILGAFDPLDHAVFQSVFGMIMTVLIALEFKHSILRVLERHEHIIQVKTVILIAQLALARKFIVLDFETVGPAKLAALAFAVLVLGVVYWLLQERDDCAVAKKRDF